MCACKAGKADVLVYGQSLSIPALDAAAQSCAIPAVGIPELGSTGANSRVIRVVTQYCNPALLLSIENIPSATCNHKYAFIDNDGAYILGSCLKGVAYYCVSPDTFGASP